jgi:hypothetical protein
MYRLNSTQNPNNDPNNNPLTMFSNTFNENLHNNINEPPTHYNTKTEPPINNDQLADQITTLAGQINAANYRFLTLIAEFEQRKAWSGYGLKSCAHWLNWKCGIDMGAAREKVRAALALTHLPKTKTAFQKGELSFSKVRALTKIATPKNESFLLNIAEYGTAQHMEKLVKSYRTVDNNLTAEEEHSNITKAQQESKLDIAKEDKQKENRSVICYQDNDGMWIIHAKLPAEEGSLVAKTLKELGDKLAEAETQPEQKDKTEPKNVSAETFSLNQTEEKLTFPQRRADALIALSEHYLATVHSSSTNSLTALKSAERCQLILHIQAGSLNQSPQHLDGQWLPPSTARRMACDAGLLIVEEDEAGNVLNIGRKSRIIPPAMARALAIRDNGCQFPGCCETRYTEGHHIKHWADGGETKLDNLVTLCRYHHRELHKGSFYLTLKPSINNTVAKTDKPTRFAQRLCFSKVEKYWKAPFNQKADTIIANNPAEFTCAHCQEYEQTEDLKGSLKQAIAKDIHQTINEKTAVTKWAGERMDMSMTIDGLLNKR